MDDKTDIQYSILTVDTLSIVSVCNLCLKQDCAISMLSAEGESNSFSEILKNCLNIDILSVDLGDTKRVICSPCAKMLSDIVKFRELVEKSLNTLEMTARLQGVKKEPEIEEDSNGDDFDNVDELNIELDIKSEQDESNEALSNIAKMRKECQKDIFLMIKSKALTKKGLFPFKVNKNKVYACAICSEKTKSLDSLKDHTLQHSPDRIYTAFKKSVLREKMRFYIKQNQMTCKKCAKVMIDYDHLKSHLANCAMRKDTLPFKLDKNQRECPVCHKTFLHFVSLNKHMNVHYPNFICENCGKAFASNARFRAHIRTHEIGVFPCRYCRLVFDKATKRENHVSKEHKTGVKYTCRQCDLPLSSFYARQKHLAEVHNQELKRYKCNVCPQSYITPGHLSSHVRRDHLNERNHKCNKCDLAFYTRNSLKMHMIKHDGERIHVCEVCQKAYQRKKTLKEHMRIHENDKRFICPVCGRAFTQKCTLKSHLKVHERKSEFDVDGMPN